MDTFEQKIKSYFGRYFKKEISYEKKGIRPVHDWNTFLVYTGCVIFVIICLSGYMYIQIENNSFFATTTDVNEVHVTIHNNLLQKTIQDIEADESAFANAQNNKNQVGDPSL